MLQPYQQAFLELAIDKSALRFGRFTLKSGRTSPYFFNAGAFDDGHSVAVLGRCYADAIVASELAFDMLFGPAYKGIPLAAAVAIALADRHQRNVPFAYNRKEAKEHGEGGQVVGAALAGRVLVVDDVISAGTSVRESATWIAEAGAEMAGVAIALDRQERGQDERSAAQEISHGWGIPVVSIANLDTMVAFLRQYAADRVDLAAIESYRRSYGVS